MFAFLVYAEWKQTVCITITGSLMQGLWSSLRICGFHRLPNNRVAEWPGTQAGQVLKGEAPDFNRRRRLHGSRRKAALPGFLAVRRATPRGHSGPVSHWTAHSTSATASRKYALWLGKCPPSGGRGQWEAGPVRVLLGVTG